ncbi:unnamed protein product [Brassica rapa subsp. trilocularis]
MSGLFFASTLRLLPKLGGPVGSNTATASMYRVSINMSSPLQSTEFLCDGKFMGIQTENTSCSNCSKKLQQCFRPSHALHVMIQSLWGSSFQVTNIYIQFIQSNLLLSYTKL